MPKVFSKELEPFRKELMKIIREKLVLKKTAYERFEINLAERISWFNFRENGKIKVFLHRDPVEKFVKKELNPLLAELPRDVSILRNLDGRIEFEGIAKSGRTVNAEELCTRALNTLENIFGRKHPDFAQVQQTMAKLDRMASGVIEVAMAVE